MHSEWWTTREAEGFEGIPSFTIAPSPRHTSGAEGLTPVPAQYVCHPAQKSQMTSSVERVEGRKRRQNEGEEEGIKEEGSTLLRCAANCQAM